MRALLQTYQFVARQISARAREHRAADENPPVEQKQ